MQSGRFGRSVDQLGLNFAVGFGVPVEDKSQSIVQAINLAFPIVVLVIESLALTQAQPCGPKLDKDGSRAPLVLILYFYFGISWDGSIAYSLALCIRSRRPTARPLHGSDLVRSVLLWYQVPTRSSIRISTQ